MNIALVGEQYGTIRVDFYQSAKRHILYPRHLLCPLPAFLACWLVKAQQVLWLLYSCVQSGWHLTELKVCSVPLLPLSWDSSLIFLPYIADGVYKVCDNLMSLKPLKLALGDKTSGDWYNSMIEQVSFPCKPNWKPISLEAGREHKICQPKNFSLSMP